MTNELFFNLMKNDYLLNTVFNYDPTLKDDLQDYIDEFEDSIEEDIVNNTHWLYSGFSFLTVVLGLYKDNVIAISEDFEIFKFCDYFQDIPFEIYRRSYELFDDERTHHENKLKEYEQWCLNNNIVVDPNNYYHDKDGRLFSSYFELNDDYNQEIINDNL